MRLKAICRAFFIELLQWHDTWWAVEVAMLGSIGGCSPWEVRTSTLLWTDINEGE
jgi:hypothetical protein